MTERQPIAHSGHLIETVDAHAIIRKAAETNKWDYSAECAKLYRRADVILERFYNGIPIPTIDGQLPAPLIAVALMNIRTLAAYRVVPDDYGLPFKLTFNEIHFVEHDGVKVWEFGEWAEMETLTHELGHHWQQLKGKDPYKPGKKVSHNREFTDKLEELGIYSTFGHGAHYKEADVDKPFGILMTEWGIVRPKAPEGFTPKDKTDWWKTFGELSGNPIRLGHSSLHKYECPECHLKVRVGVGDDPKIIHGPCTEKTGQKVFFVKADELTHTIFKA